MEEIRESELVPDFPSPAPRLLDVKDIVDRHHALIVRNIVPSEELYQALLYYGALTGPMIDDVKDSVDREERVYKILDLVAIKGPSKMSALCDALQQCGHAFIADFIRDEMKELTGKDKEATRLPFSADFAEGKDIVKYLCGKFERALHETEKEELCIFLEKRFQTALQKRMYKMNKEDKEKALEAKQHQLEESFRFNEVLEEQNKMVIELKDKLGEAITESASKGVQLGDMKKYMRELSKKHEAQMAGQLKFNAANDSSLRRLTERTFANEKACIDMMEMMEPYMPDLEQYQTKRQDFESQSTDRIITQHDRCQWMLKKLLLRMADLIRIEEKYLSLREEREYILTYIGIAKEKHESISLKLMFHDFITGKETELEKLIVEKKEMKERLMAIHNRAREAEEKVSQLSKRQEMLTSSREEAYIQDLTQRENEILGLKANRDKLLDQHSAKDETIREMEKQITKLQHNMTMIEKVNAKSQQHLVIPNLREKVQSQSVHEVKQGKDVEVKEMRPFGSMPKFGAPLSQPPSKRGSLKGLGVQNLLPDDPDNLPPIKNPVIEKPRSTSPLKGRPDPRPSVLVQQNNKLAKQFAPTPGTETASFRINQFAGPKPDMARISRRTTMDQYHQGK